MIVEPSNADTKHAYGSVGHDAAAFAHTAAPSSSTLPPPPTFEESLAQSQAQPHTLIDIGADGVFIPQGGEEPPPAFTPYEAEYSLASDGSIFSHDEHLNRDGEALYRFLLSRAAEPPTYVLHVRGTHEESHTRLVTRTDAHGKTHTRTEVDTTTVTDFDFKIDVGQHILTGGADGSQGVVHWSIADQQPAYRGRMVHDVGLPSATQRARKREIKAAEDWAKQRERRGLPPWVGEDRGVDTMEQNPYSVLQSSWSLRQWADDYCKSPKYLKEFIYDKVVYGWNTDALIAAVRAAVLSTHYTGNLSVSFDTSSSKICIRSNNWLSRAISNKWLKFLLIITLIYPFIYLFRRFHSRGGGLWEVCGGAYALKAWANAPPPDVLLADPLDDPVDAGPGAVSKRRLVKTREGVKVLQGAREGEWYQQWENTIRNGVLARRQERMPLTVPETLGGWNPMAMVLDGYV